MAKQRKRRDETADLARQVKKLRGSLKALRREVAVLEAEAERPPPPPFPPRFEAPGRGGFGARGFGPGGPWSRGRRGPGGGPVIGVEVPLEGDDPTVPLWATIAARLPDEIPVVDGSGRVVHYRYSAVGSTMGVPRYRRVADGPDCGPDEKPPLSLPTERPERG
jgi:hypothetical protein